jgi:hypothetical protein
MSGMTLNPSPMLQLDLSTFDDWFDRHAAPAVFIVVFIQNVKSVFKWLMFDCTWWSISGVS